MTAFEYLEKHTDVQKKIEDYNSGLFKRSVKKQSGKNKVKKN